MIETYDVTRDVSEGLGYSINDRLFFMSINLLDIIGIEKQQMKDKFKNVHIQIEKTVRGIRNPSKYKSIQSKVWYIGTRNLFVPVFNSIFNIKEIKNGLRDV